MISMVIIKFKIPMTNPKRITLPKLENVNDQPSDIASLKFLLSEKIDIKDKPKKAVSKKLNPYCTNMPITGIKAKITETIKYPI